MKPQRLTQTKTTSGITRAGNAKSCENASAQKFAHPILRLQRMIGNRAVQRLIESPEVGMEAGYADEEASSRLPISDVVGNGLNSPGRPLDTDIRNFMEARFGFDFGSVRIHTDPSAAESSEAINAEAYTIGQDVVFGEGAYSPGNSEGKKLVAHELTHILQQASGPAVGSALLDESISISEPEDPSEKEAEEVSALVSSSDINSLSTVQGASSPAAPGATVQREGDAQGEESIWDTLAGPATSGGGWLVDQGLHLAGAAEGAGPLVPGVGGLFAGASEVLEGAKEGGVLGGLKATGGGLEIGGGIGEAALAGGAAEAGLAGVLADAGPVGLALGAGLAGGHVLSEHTSVGTHSVESLGGLDAMLTGEGERPWALTKSEAMGDNWDQGNYLSAAGDAAQLAGFGLVGALGGIGGGIVDAADYLNPFK